MSGSAVVSLLFGREATVAVSLTNGEEKRKHERAAAPCRLIVKHNHVELRSRSVCWDSGVQ